MRLHTGAATVDRGCLRGVEGALPSKLHADMQDRVA